MAQLASGWTLADLNRLPNDGNTYEVIDGELFVTPAPSPVHEQLAAALHELLLPYVQREQLGQVYTGKSVIQTLKSQIEPDLMVRKMPRPIPQKWSELPSPILVVEVLSGVTQRRDHVEKRAFYLRTGVAEYWIVNRWDRTIRVISADNADVTVDTTFMWHPTGAGGALVVDVAEFFRKALD